MEEIEREKHRKTSIDESREEENNKKTPRHSEFRPSLR